MRRWCSAALCTALVAAAGCGDDDSSPAAEGAKEPVATGDVPAPRAEGYRYQGPDTTPAEAPPEPKRPARRKKAFRGTAETAARVVERQLGGRTERGQRRVAGSQCSRGRCVVRYVSHSRGRGRMLADQAEILTKLFRDDSLREVRFLVHHQTVGRHKDERLPILEVSCGRAAHRAIRRSGAAAIEDRCRTLERSGRHREAPHSLRGKGRGRR